MNPGIKNENVATFLAIFCRGLLTPVCNVLRKFLFNDLYAPQVELIAKLSACVIVLFTAPKIAMPSKNCAILALIAGVTGALWMAAIALANVGNILALNALQPMYIIICQYIFFDIKIEHPYHLGMCFLTGIFGVTLILQPPFLFSGSTMTTWEWIGYFLVIVENTIYAFQVNLSRTAQIESMQLTFWQLFANCILFVVIQLVSWRFDYMSISQIIVTECLGVSTGTWFIMMNFAYAILNPSFSGLLILLSVPMTYFLQFLILGVPVDLMGCTGIIITLSSVAFYTSVKARKEIKEDLNEDEV